MYMYMYMYILLTRARDKMLVIHYIQDRGGSDKPHVRVHVIVFHCCMRTKICHYATKIRS